MRERHKDSLSRVSASGHLPRPPGEEVDPRASRRGFLGGLGGIALGALGEGADSPLGDCCDPPGPPAALEAIRAEARRYRALLLRHQAAVDEFTLGTFPKETNGDEARYPERIGNYSKGLPHNDLGEVDPEAYDALLCALASGRWEDFEAIPLGGRLRLTNPLGGLTYDLIGPDAAAVPLDPPPALASAEAAAQMAELYWMALCRDIPFTDYPTDPTIAAAIDDLRRYSGYRGPRPITPQTIFRIDSPGTLEGPMVSQFLLQPWTFDGIGITSRLQVPLPVTTGDGIDFLTSYEEWLAAQRGFPVGTTISPPRMDPVPRHIHDLRALGQHAGADVHFSSYLRAALILLSYGDQALSERNPYRSSRTQTGFASFGASHLLTLMGCLTRASHHGFYGKWYVDRYLRPDAFGGRVHNRRRGAADYPIHEELLGSPVLDRIHAYNRLVNRRRGLNGGAGSYLLPVMIPIGSPTDPSYPAGHGYTAGSRASLLKAWFNEDFVLPSPVKPNRDGTALEPYVPGVDGPPLTVAGEINKLAHNTSMGRDAYGVHYRADDLAGFHLGEELAIRTLREERPTYAESVFEGFVFTRFDGTVVEL
ncbi:hypothetical protein SOCE26_020710 [Sorangium cellulosum]|uniref:Phosphoesterase n=1 Tax=Sorangium cellulosum TaxID=56 RepID=A0A2L0EN12_SORCE|nr:hypothetical protein [Sorangium cellulosum]AUX40670.1 hypothetical protein SOCE26_020710 [Sorangium cellulosum]